MKRNKLALFPRFKNALFGRAWSLCHKRPDMTVVFMMDDGQTEVELFKQYCASVKDATQDIKPVAKSTKFKGYFRSGRRRLGESIEEFIQ